MQRKAQLQLEVELAKAKAKEDALNNVENSKPDTKPHKELKPKVEASCNTPIKDQESKETTRREEIYLKQSEPEHTGQIQALIKQQQETISALTLPQPELQVFNGDPTDYHDFIRAFEHLVERKTQSESVRLYYLVQYISGQVHELVRSCLAMPKASGYSRARTLLVFFIKNY